MKKIFLLLAFLTSAIFVFAQDTDGDGVLDVNDCQPNDPTKWASVIYLDADGDQYTLCISGCFGGALPRWNVIFEGGIINVGYSYSPGAGGDCNDNDPYELGYGCDCAISGDADNDGEPDYTDPAPNNPLLNHSTLEICNGVDDNYNGIVDENCNNCILGVNAGSDEHLLFGYSPAQCKTKTAVVNNGTGIIVYNYNWSLDRALLPDEIITGANTASVTICLMDTAQLFLTVTDANNCVARDTAVIFAEDVRCYSGNSTRVSICHSGQMICVNSNAVASHIAHGDYIGACTVTVANPGDLAIEQNPETGFKIYPNPSNGNFIVTMNLPSTSTEKVIRIINSNGQVVKEQRTQQNRVSMNFSKEGIYILQIISGKQITSKRLIVADH